MGRKLPKDRARQLEKANRNEKSWELESCGIIGVRELLGIADAQAAEVKERKIILGSQRTMMCSICWNPGSW